MFILLLTFLGTYDWYPVRGGEVSKEILESSIVKRFGEENFRKSFIKLDAEIFEGGCMVLVPKGYRVREVPRGLKMMVNYIEMEKYDRYSAVYEYGELEMGWNDLKRELRDNVGGFRFGTPSLEWLRNRLIPRGVSGSEGSSNRPQSEEDKDIEYPRKIYYSFLLIEKNRKELIIPVLLVLSPVGEIYKELRKEMKEVEEGGG